MKVTKEKMLELIESSLFEALRGESDSFESPLSGHSSPIANEISKRVLLAAETLAHAMQIFKQFWQQQSQNFTYEKLQQSESFINNLWSSKLSNVKNLLNFEPNELQIIRNQFPEILQIINTMNDFVGYKRDGNDVIGQFNQILNMLMKKNLNDMIIKRIKKTKQNFTNDQIQTIIVQTGKNLINSLFDFESSIFNILKQARGLFSNISQEKPEVKEPIPLTIKNAQGNMQNAVYSVLNDLDKTVVEYYSSIETLFQVLIGIGYNLKYSNFDIAQNMFGVSEPDDKESNSLSLDRRWKERQRRKGNKETFKRDMMDLFQSPQYTKEEFIFNLEAFVDFVLQIGTYKRTDYPKEYKKARVIKQLFDQIKEKESKIGIMFGDPKAPTLNPQFARSSVMNRAKSDRNDSTNYGRFNNFLFDKQNGNYIFPEIKPMFKNMLRVKFLYKSKFNEILNKMREFEDLQNAKFSHTENPLYSTNFVDIPKRKYKDLQEFFQNEMGEIKRSLMFFQFARIEFKSLMNKMLTGNSFGSEQDIASMVNKLSPENQAKIDKRIKYYNIFKNLGWLPKEAGDEMPSWLYSH